jgi:hypothetical protein
MVSSVEPKRTPPMFEALQASDFARRVSESLLGTAALSATHLLGFTLIMGSALVSGLRLLGWIFPERPADEVVRPAMRTLAVGLALSAITGALLFVPRAASAVGNGIFQLKMLLLAAAVVFQLTGTRLASRSASASASTRLAGGLGLALWIGVALAGCAFILIE